MRIGNGSITSTVIKQVESAVRELCENNSRRLPFHGWHHIAFVSKYAVQFADANGSDVDLVHIAALVHDLNYVAKSSSRAADGRVLRRTVLADAGLDERTTEAVERTVLEAETRSRGRSISAEAQALSDADTLFKALPITPVLLANKFMDENNMSISKLANKIVSEQQPLADQGIYFYSEEATKKYGGWAEMNLELWASVRESLDHPGVQELLSDMQGKFDSA